MTTISVPVTTDGGEMPATLWLPAGGRGPGLLLLQEIFGVSAYIRRRAQDLADLGYVVLAPALYWRLGRNEVEGDGAMEEAFGLVQQIDWDSAVGDAVAALGVLEQREETTGGVGVFGFCFGGGLAFNVAAVADPTVLVSYYGSALPDLLELAPQVTMPALYHFGEADSYIDHAKVQQIRDAVDRSPQSTFVTYEGADHAFDNDDFHLYNQAASRLAWAKTVEWLAENLPV